ncbi:hypothetical protein U9M48_000159 [Paspalum notatum var. saurae]|uniref:Proliferating cell nuclear antigen PCNA N-terminal domain-containing protein n=1 Tax=Paspalum notatum var. saurae TaxID=547442 RepID=A0AAQ3PL69_PASNO
MLELPLVKGDPFHHVLEAILDLSDVAHVVCTRRGLNLQAVDTKRAAIVSLLFPAEDFKGYTCDEYISMGIQSATWSRPSAAATRKTPSPSRSAKKTSAPLPYHSCRPKSTVDYEFRLVDAELARFELPDRQFLGSKYQGSVKMPSVEFRRICKYLSLISVTDEDLTFFAKGTNGDVYMYKQAFGWAYVKNRHNTWEQFYVYWMCPFIGAILAAWMFRAFFLAPAAKAKAKKHMMNIIICISMDRMEYGLALDIWQQGQGMMARR